jgi:indole-3-acetate monooxygenase
MSTTSIEVAELVLRATEVGETAQHAAPDAERAGRLSDDVVGAIRSSGLPGLGLPGALGGFASPPVATTEVLERIATCDAASAWIVMIASTASLNAAYLPPVAAAAIYANGSQTMTAGVFAPKGRGTRVEGGYRISGWWPFCSGSLHADWITGGFMVEGESTFRAAFFPADEVEIIDSWHVMGLAATGSHDFRVDDCFVPEDHTIAPDVDPPWADEPLYRFPLYGMLALGVASVMLGIARGAIDDLVELATEKVPTGSRRTLAERPAVQQAIAQSEARLGSARAYMHDRIGEAWDLAVDGHPVEGTTRAGLRMAATHAAESAVDVVESMFRAAGGTSIYRTSRLERRFRDVNTAAQHMMISQPTWEMVGRALLGVGDHSQL